MTNNTINNMIINAIGAPRDKSREIVAVFHDGREIVYTRNILALLKTDPAIKYVFDANTGEII